MCHLLGVPTLIFIRGPTQSLHVYGLMLSSANLFSMLAILIIFLIMKFSKVFSKDFYSHNHFFPPTQVHERVLSILCIRCSANTQWHSKPSGKCVDNSLGLMWPHVSPIIAHCCQVNSASPVLLHYSHTLRSRIIRPDGRIETNCLNLILMLLICSPTYLWNLIFHAFFLYLLSI